MPVGRLMGNTSTKTPLKSTKNMNNKSRQQIVIKPKNGSSAMALLRSGRALLLLVLSWLMYL